MKTDLTNLLEYNKEKVPIQTKQLDPICGLVLDPSNELKFMGPYTVILTVSNLSGTKLAFKVCTTAVKRYTVKPNCGILGPGQSMKTNGMLIKLIWFILFISKI